MQRLLQKNYRVIGLSVLYIVCITSIVLAFPKNVGYSESVGEGVYLGAANPTSLGLPVNIEWGQGKNIVKAPVIPSKVEKDILAPVPKKVIIQDTKRIITCGELSVCNKIIFGDGYTDRQKTQYYTIILETIDSIQKSLTQKNRISDILTSLSLSNNVGDRRGWGGSKTILINTKDISTSQEFREILTHELGHIIDLGVMIGVSNQYDEKFTLGGVKNFGVDDKSLDFYRISRDSTSIRKADALYVDFVGGYAMSSPYEDFSESFNMYIWHNDVFRAMALGSQKLQKKYNFIQSIIGGLILHTDWQNVTKINANKNRRPWDSTRMSLE